MNPLPLQANARPLEILLVEDSPTDARLMSILLGESRIPNRTHTVQDGDSAMAFLRRQGTYTDAPEPDLVLLDLNLPGMDGREVLRTAKSDTMLRHIPVVVLSTSRARRDVRESYEMQANCYVCKADDLEGFERALQAIEDFWFRTAELPLA